MELFFLSKVKWTAAAGLIQSVDLFFIYRCTFSLAGIGTEWIFTTKAKAAQFWLFTQMGFSLSPWIVLSVSPSNPAQMHPFVMFSLQPRGRVHNFPPSCAEQTSEAMCFLPRCKEVPESWAGNASRLFFPFLLCKSRHFMLCDDFFSYLSIFAPMISEMAVGCIISSCLREQSS